MPYAEEYTVQWRIYADEDDGPLVVAGQAQEAPHNLPAPGDAYNVHNEGSSTAFCTTVQCRKRRVFEGNKSEFRYICTFGQTSGAANKDAPPGDVLPGDSDPDPLQRPEREWYEWESSTDRFMRDAVSGKPVENSAREPLTQYTTDTAKLVHVVMQRWAGHTTAEKTALLDMLQAIKLRVNSTLWRTHEPNTVLMRPPGVFGPRYENGKTYYEVTFRAVQYDALDRDLGAVITPEDWGTQELVFIRSGWPYRRPVKITDGGYAVTSPVKLDGQGRRLPDQAALPQLLDGTGGKPGPYTRYLSVDFNTYIPDPPVVPAPP